MAVLDHLVELLIQQLAHVVVQPAQLVKVAKLDHGLGVQELFVLLLEHLDVRYFVCRYFFAVIHGNLFLLVSELADLFLHFRVLLYVVLVLLDEIHVVRGFFLQNFHLVLECLDLIVLVMQGLEQPSVLVLQHRHTVLPLYDLTLVELIADRGLLEHLGLVQVTQLDFGQLLQQVLLLQLCLRGLLHHL